MSSELFLVGICDDSREDLDRIGCAVQKGMAKLNYSVKADCRFFSDGEKLCAAAGKERFDVYIIDIEMPEQNGFSLAKRLCMGKDAPRVIFVSVHENFVFDSQEYMPLWFVRKGMLERDMFLALRQYFTLLPPKEACLMLKGFAAGGKIPVCDIVYIECMGHLLTVHTKSGELLKQYKSLKALEKELEGYHFVRIHKSYLVNQKYIEEIGKRNVCLTDGTLLEMGRDRRKTLCEAMKRYERDYYGNQRVYY